MKCIRKMLRVSWTQKKTNEWVLEAAGVEQDLLNLTKRRKLSYFGHVIRKEGDWRKRSCKTLFREFRKQGRPKSRWMDEMENWAKMSFEKILKETEDRWRWHRLVHEATNPRNEDG